MNKQPLITTLITTYKRPELLKRAILSALNQTYSHLIVYVFDNASDDETEEMVRNLMLTDSRIRYHRHPINIGMMGNYQFALSQVKTPLFSLLSDDDLLLPWFYETALEGFAKHPDIAFSATSTLVMTSAGQVDYVPMDLWIREGYFFTTRRGF